MTSNHQRATSPQRALITGASSGIGAAFAERLAKDGYDLGVVARRGDRLEALAKRLRAERGVQVEVIVADLTNAADLRRLEARITEGEALDLLVNNAGFAVYKPLVANDPDVLEEMILLNVVALTRLTRAALPAMVARNKGSIINVASGLAFVPQATRATYSGTKAYVVNFTRAIHQEVADTGVHVQALCPGLTRTEFHQRSGTDLSLLPPQIVMSPEAVVDASLAGLRLGEVVCLPGLTDLGDLARFEEAQATMAQNMVRNGQPAERYRNA